MFLGGYAPTQIDTFRNFGRGTAPLKSTLLVFLGRYAPTRIDTFRNFGRGTAPLKQHIFTESSGSSPTQTTLFMELSGLHSLRKITYIVNLCAKIPYFLSWAQYFTHSFWSFLQKRVGTIPLEPHFFIKTSGADPTQTAYFHKIEWVKPRSNYIFLQNRVGQAPLAFCPLVSLSTL